MALIALVIGSAMAVAATGRLTLSLAASTTLVWSWVPLVQLLTGLLLVRGADIGVARALEGYFQTHRPWSLWLLACAVAIALLPNPGGALLLLAATFVVPLVVTVRMLKVFCRRELGLGAAQTRRRVALHQAVTWTVVLVYGGYAIALIPRVSGRLGW